MPRCVSFFPDRLGRHFLGTGFDPQSQTVEEMSSRSAAFKSQQSLLSQS